MRGNRPASVGVLRGAVVAVRATVVLGLSAPDAAGVVDVVVVGATEVEVVAPTEVVVVVVGATELVVVVGATEVVVGPTEVVVGAPDVVVVVGATELVVVVGAAEVVVVVGATELVVAPTEVVEVVGPTAVLDDELLDVGPVVEVAGAAQPGRVTRFVSSVTEALRASSRPWTMASVFAVIALRAIIVPTNREPTPSVPELPTFQNTLHACAPLTSDTRLFTAVMTVDPAWKMNVASGLFCPLSVRVPVIAKEVGDWYTPPTSVCPPRSVGPL